MTDITQILSKIEQGDPSAAEQLLPIVYEELRKLAAHRMTSERADHTLQPTALVHEAYLRLVRGQPTGHWNSRGHFFAAAAEAMRRILIESARRRQRQRLGGGETREAADLAHLSTSMSDPELLKLDEALKELKLTAPDRARLVELRFFAGMTVDEAAKVLGISSATVKRQWRIIKAWLHQQLRPTEED